MGSFGCIKGLVEDTGCCSGGRFCPLPALAGWSSLPLDSPHREGEWGGPPRRRVWLVGREARLSPSAAETNKGTWEPSGDTWRVRGPPDHLRHSFPLQFFMLAVPSVRNCPPPHLSWHLILEIPDRDQWGLLTQCAFLQKSNPNLSWGPSALYPPAHFVWLGCPDPLAAGVGS